MTTHDFDQPYMIYEGAPPPHLLRKAAEREQQWADEDEEERQGLDWSSLLIISLVLVFGIVIGVCATLTWRAFAPRPEPEAVAAAPSQLQQDVFASVPGGKAVARPGSPAAAAIRAPIHKPRAAKSTHLRSSLAAGPAAASARAKATIPARGAADCEAAPTRAERAICANPSLAAADQEMRRAYQRALDAGAPPMPLRASQQDWLIASEVAADHSTLDLAASYASRIAELNALARREPPH